jgi:hypothetical protein
VTRAGRKLTASGNAYWEKLYRAGRTDGQGHIVKAGVGAEAAAKERPPSPTVRQVTREQAKAYKKRAPSEAVVREQGLDLAAGRALSAEGFRRAGFVPNPLDNPVTRFVGKAGSEIGEAMLYTPAGLYEAEQAARKDVQATASGDFSFKRSRRLGAAVGKGFAESLNPVEHPGLFALNLLAGAGAAAGAAGRIGAAGRAAAAARAAGRAAQAGRYVPSTLAARPVAAAARALVRSPEPAARTLEFGGLTVNPLVSRNRAAAGFQRGYDVVVNRALRENPEGLVGRVGQRRVARELGKERQVAEQLSRAPALALSREGRVLTDPQETALRVVAEGQPVDARIRAHQRDMVGKPGHVKRDLAQKIRLLEASRRYIVETPEGPSLNPAFRRSAGRWFRRGVTPTGLRELYERAKTVSERREVTLRAAGRLGGEQIAGRVQAPGRVVGGAEYVKPTPGKLGLETPALEKARAYEQRLGKAVGRAEARVAKGEFTAEQRAQMAAGETGQLGSYTVVGGKKVPGETNVETSRAAAPHVDPEMQARAQSFSTLHERVQAADPPRSNAAILREAAAADDDLAGLVDDYRGVERSDYDPGPDGAGDFWSDREQAWEAVKDRLDELSSEAADELAAAATEAAPGQTTIPVWGQTGPGRMFRPKGSERLERMRAAHGVAKERVAQLEQASANRVEPTGLVGEEGFTRGKIRVPYTATVAPRTIGRAAGYKGGTPRPPGSITHPYTGGLLRTGNFRDRTTQLIAESAMEAERYGNVLAFRDRIRAAARPTPEGDNWVAIRLDNLETGRLPREVKEVQAKLQAIQDKTESGVKLSRAERADLEGSFERFRTSIILGGRGQVEQLVRERPDLARLFEQGKIGWVPERILGEYGQPAPLVGIKQHAGGRATINTVDAINNASRLAILYLKPAYAIPNIVGNAALNLVQQGFAAPANLTRAARVNARLSAAAAAKLDTVMGEGFVRAIQGEGRGVGSRAVSGAANIWSQGVDVPFRRSAFLYEARRALRGQGLRADWQGIERLLSDATLQDTLVNVARRANKEIIDYANLGPMEREVVRRAIFFYPWVKGSTYYAKRFLVEHPLKAAAAAQLGEEGRARAQKDLGPVPSFGRGMFKAGGGIVNPAAAALLGTPAQVVDTAVGLAQGDVTSARKLSQFLTPAAGLAIAETARVDPRTGFGISPRKSALRVAKEYLIDPLPQATLARRLRGSKSTSIFQATPRQAVGQFLVGGLYPRRYNPEALGEAAHREARALMTPGQRVLDDHKQMREDFLRGAKDAGLLKPDATQLPKPLKEATILRAKRYSAYASRGIRDGDPHYQQKAYEADIALLIKRGVLTEAAAAGFLKRAKAATEEELEQARGKIGDKYFGGAILSDARAALKERGVPISG